MIKRTGLILCACLCTLSLFAQNGVRVTGTVTEASGEALIGVNIIVKGIRTGVITDIDGKYDIQVPGRDAVLVL
ncbi:MAG: carboxypeptidase-like regulatory domain-containing protein [Tannerellaceae bacterium]|nr:carboxypeptidase-like regulatory domain-containing protein [Tannerellaceae bacterium]